MALTALAALVVLGLAVQQGMPAAPVPAESAAERYGALPLSFIPNRGQTDARARYYAQAPGFAAYFTREGVSMTLSRGKVGYAIELRFRGANRDARIEALDRRAGRLNYFGGSERYANIPTFGRVAYRDLWPGIDLVFAGARGQLKYEFHVAPDADPSDIRLAYAGVESVSVAAGGALAVRTRVGTLKDAPPRTSQAGRPIPSLFTLHGKRSYGFAVGPYDHGRPLIIDPGLEYSTFLGGGLDDEARDVAVDAGGHAYVTGQTSHQGFPTTPGAFASTGPGRDVFVTKLNPSGSALVYSTVLVGDEDDMGWGIAVDAQGNAYVTGNTGSQDFPDTPGAFDRNKEPGIFSDAFVTKLNPSGSALVYSTFIGGNENDFDNAFDIAIDALGNAYVAGSTESPTSFPTTEGAFDRTRAGPSDPFVLKLNPGGTALVYSTLLGGSGSVVERARGIAVDADGAAYVTGSNESTDFPTTPGAFDTTPTQDDAFVTKVAPAGNALEYSTLLGDIAEGFSIAVDDQEQAFVALKAGAGFPTTPAAYDTTHNGDLDVAVTKLNASASDLVYSTYIGGANEDLPWELAVDDAGRAWVAGRTLSNNFPTTPQAHQTTYAGFGDAFATRLSPSGSALGYSTYLGGAARFDEALGLALDPAGDAYVSGSTESPDFPTTPGAFDTTFNSTVFFRPDAFVSKLHAVAGPPATLTLTPESATNTVGEGAHCVTASLADAAGEPTPGIEVTFTVTGATSASGSETTDGNGEATFCYQGPELPGTDQITAAVEPDGPSDTASKTWVTPQSSEDCKVNAEGRIRAQNGDRADFGLEAKMKNAGSARGRARYTDRGPADHLELNVKSIDALVCEGRDATIFAHQGEVSFRIEVSDRSRNGRQDRFRIVTAQGYDSGLQPLVRGNVKVR